MGNEELSSKVLKDLLFLKIFQTFRIAIQPSKLIIAFLTVAIICLVGWLMDFSNTVVTMPSYTHESSTELQVYITRPHDVPSFIERYKEKGERRGVFSTLWNFSAAKFHNSLKSLFAFDILTLFSNITDCLKALVWAFGYHFVYSIIFFAITLTVVSITGGSICRITALQFARGEKAGLTEAMSFSLKRFLSFFAAPLAPVCIITAIGLFISCLGLICNIPVIGELITAIFIPLALIAGALIATILIGAVAGFNLMFPAVAYDGSDCFDAISRSFSYVYAKPWRMGFYTTIAAIYGAICYFFVRFFAFLLLFATRQFMELAVWVDNSSKEINKLTAIWPKPDFMNLVGSSDLAVASRSESLAAFLVHLFLLAVLGLIVSFIISFYFSANTIIYSLMRKMVDNTALKNVYTNLGNFKINSTPANSEKSQTQPKSDTNTDSPDQE